MSKKAPKKAANPPAGAQTKKRQAGKKPAAKKANTKSKPKAAKKAAKKAAPKKTANLPAKAKAKQRQAGKVAPKKTTKKVALKKPVKKISKPAVKAAVKIKKDHPVLLKAIIDGLEERKAKNITVLDLTGIGGRSFDYFVLADADSGTHVESIASSVETEVKKNAGERPYHTEGWQNAEWILLDYINIIVHVFQRPVREFYNLEGLWADAHVEKIN